MLNIVSKKRNSSTKSRSDIKDKSETLWGHRFKASIVLSYQSINSKETACFSRLLVGCIIRRKLWIIFLKKWTVGKVTLHPFIEMFSQEISPIFFPYPFVNSVLSCFCQKSVLDSETHLRIGEFATDLHMIHSSCIGRETRIFSGYLKSLKSLQRAVSYFRMRIFPSPGQHATQFEFVCKNVNRLKFHQKF